MKKLIVFMFSIVLLGSCTKTTYCVYCTEVYTEMETETCGFESEEAGDYIANITNNNTTSEIWVCTYYEE